MRSELKVVPRDQFPALRPEERGTVRHNNDVSVQERLSAQRHDCYGWSCRRGCGEFTFSAGADDSS